MTYILYLHFTVLDLDSIGNTEDEQTLPSSICRASGMGFIKARFHFDDLNSGRKDLGWFHTCEDLSGNDCLEVTVTKDNSVIKVSVRDRVTSGGDTYEFTGPYNELPVS